MRAVRELIVSGMLVLVAGVAWAQDPLAVLTEIQVKKGKVEVKVSGQDLSLIHI